MTREGFGGEVAHWECECGQPNAKERDKCIACDKIPTEKRFRKKRMLDGGRGRPKAEYY